MYNFFGTSLLNLELAEKYAKIADLYKIPGLGFLLLYYVRLCQLRLDYERS